MAEKKTKKTTSHKPRSTTSESNGKPERGVKTAFIRQHLDKAPLEVVRLAAEKGIALTAGYVSNQQSKLRKKGNGGSSADAGVAGLTKLVRTLGVRKAKELVAIAAKLDEDSTSSDFVEIVQVLGIDRARDVITIIETVDAATNRAPDQSTAETT